MFRDGHDQRAGIRSHHAREDGRINDEKIVSAIDLSIEIHDRSAVVDEAAVEAQTTRADPVVGGAVGDRVWVRGDEGLDGRVGGRVHHRDARVRRQGGLKVFDSLDDGGDVLGCLLVWRV